MTDTQTGLIWLKNPGCFPAMDFAAANNAAASLHSGQCGLTDGSAAGSWRLPTQNEWAAILKATCYGPGIATIPERTGVGCFDTSVADPWADGVQVNIYWSSAAYADVFGAAWFATLYWGYVDYTGKINTFLVWPVRGGQ